MVFVRPGKDGRTKGPIERPLYDLPCELVRALEIASLYDLFCTTFFGHSDCCSDVLVRTCSNMATTFTNSFTLLTPKWERKIA